MAGLIAGLMEPVSRWDGHYHPLGPMYISSFLDKHSCTNYLINKKLLGLRGPVSDCRELDDRILNKIGELNIDVLGIACALNEVDYVLSFARSVRKRYQQIKIVAGGPMPTTCPELFLRGSEIDFVARGEGEETMLNLLKSLESSGDISGVRGISWRMESEVIHNPPQPLIEDINSMPMPAYEKVDMRQYASMHEWVIRGFPLKGVFLLSSRGCPYHCTFCGASLVHGRKIRFRGPENIYGEVKFLKEKYGIEGVFFCDDTLMVNPGHLLGVCRVMKELGMLWSCFARVDNVKEDLVKEMKKSGCIQLDFGVESGSDRILSGIMKKGTTVRQAEEAFAICRRQKMRTFANLMMGLPTETESEAYQTLSLAGKLRANAYVMSIAMPIPGTELWNVVRPGLNAGEYGKLNWHGENPEITGRCNRSRMETGKLIRLHNRFTAVLQKRAAWNTFINCDIHLVYMMRMDNKLARFRCGLRYILKQVRIVHRVYLLLKNAMKKRKK